MVTRASMRPSGRVSSFCRMTTKRKSRAPQLDQTTFLGLTMDAAFRTKSQ